MQFKDLKGLFIDADNFTYEKDDSSDDEALSQIANPKENEFNITTDKNTSDKSLCKIYNPDILIYGRNEASKTKSDQPYYAQLQILRESILIKKLEHPAIIKLVGLNLYNDKIAFHTDPGEVAEGETSPTLFLEYAQRKSLQDFIQRKRLSSSLKPVKRQICIIGITAAVRFLHQHNVVHRGLNPSSIWLDNNYYPKIFDFSRSREFLPDEGPNDFTNADNGKCLYTAPEAIEGSYQFQFLNKLDVYSLGRLIYLLVTGVEPFKHKNDKFFKSPNHKIMEAITEDNENIPYFPENVSIQFQELLKSCWLMNPSDRPQADSIYNLFVNDDPNDNENSSFLIDNFSFSELQEISNYKMMLRDLETEEKAEFQTSLTEGGNFFRELNEESVSAKFERLKGYIKNNSVKQNKDDFFEIIKELAKTEDFYDQGFLPKVMKYINLYLENNNPEALEFIEVAFGKSNFPKTSIVISADNSEKPIKIINIPQSVQIIPCRAFANFVELQRVYIPETVESIEDEAFIGCKKLTYVSLPNSIKDENLGKFVFKDCTSLDNIIIPKYLTNIQESTFENNKSLTYITLNQNLLQISDKAFPNCESLKEITIPDSVTHIGKHAFKLCKNLEIINFKKAAKYQITFIKMGHRYNSK